MFADFYKTDKEKIDEKYSQYNLICNCPHCGAFPNEEKTKKFKCNNCNKFVFVKKINYKYYFLTEPQKNEISEMRKFDALKERYFNLLVNNKYAQNQLDNDFEKNEITSIEELRNFIWSSFNHLISINSNDVQRQSLIYFNMANFCALERYGNDVFTFKKLAFDMQLKSFEKDPAKGFIWEVVIVSSPKHTECYNDNGKKIPLTEIVKNPILPHFIKDSVFGCSCAYGLSARRDENGHLIYTDF